MAGEVFVDTAFLIALLRAGDAHHSEAKQLASRLKNERARLVSTDAVLLEFANYFARLPARAKAIETIASIRTNAGWTIERLEVPLVARAEARYRRFADKDWSLTDCISMEVMERRGVRRAATTDAGFAQAGFEVLL